MSLSTRTKSVSGVLNLPKNSNKNTLEDLLGKLKNYLDANSTEYYFIVHDKDTKEENGKLLLKTIHIHFLFKSNQNQGLRLSTYINELSDSLGLDTLCISVSTWRDYEGAIQYLIHKNNPDKFLYDSSEIITNMSINTLSLVLERECKEYISIDYIRKLVLESEGKIFNVYQRLGLENSKTYRSVIMDLMSEYSKQRL